MSKQNPNNILDIATGTGDLAFELAKLKPDKITGIDISGKMLEIARKKAIKKKLQDRVFFKAEDGSNMSFENNTFDAASIAFGVRNFENPEAGLRDIYRVLKPGGKIYILEFGMPEKQPIKGVYKFYFLKILPFFGKLFSGNKKAYKYLPDSVGNFLYGEKFMTLMKKSGFDSVAAQRLSAGIAYLYTGVKQ